MKTARKKSSSAAVAPGEVPSDCAKLVARNVAFEATEREVRDVFKTFGELKSVRLPKKVTGSHRGFAFVEFQVGNLENTRNIICMGHRGIFDVVPLCTHRQTY